MVRLLAAALALLLAPAAEAACSGASLLDRLEPSDRAAFDARLATIPHGEGLIWTARKDGTEITLAGTIHLPDPRLDPLLARLAPALDAAGLVLLEMTPAEETAMQEAMAADPSRMFLTEGPTLPEMLDEETWAAVAEAASERGVPSFLAAKFRPWFLMLTLSVPPCASDEMASGIGGLDHRIMDYATEHDIPMAAVEPWDTLFSLFADGTEEEQLDLLRLSLIAPDLQGEMMAATLDGYFDERIAEIWELSRVALDFLPEDERASARESFAETEETLLTGRNRDWLPVILEAAARHDRLVVAVGAAHLPGEDGLLSLLAAEGWTVARAD